MATQFTKKAMKEALSKYDLRVALPKHITAEEMAEMVQILEKSQAAAKIFCHINQERNERSAINIRLRHEASNNALKRGVADDAVRRTQAELSAVKRALDDYQALFKDALDSFLDYDKSIVLRAVKAVRDEMFPRQRKAV